MNSLVRFKFLIALAALAPLGCGANKDPDEAVPCATVTNCKSYQLAPACSDMSTTYCDKNIDSYLGTPGACVYRLSNLPSCPCLGGEVRYCSAGTGGGAGAGGGPSLIQDCVPSDAQTTSWGGCHN